MRGDKLDARSISESAKGTTHIRLMPIQRLQVVVSSRSELHVRLDIPDSALKLR
jgi:hypothetical protein